MKTSNRFESQFRGLKWSVAVLLGTLAAGCGSGGGGGQDPILGGGGSADLAPTVTTVVPASGATVYTTARTLTATFSKAMDPASLTPSSFTLTCLVGAAPSGAVTYAGNVATLTLASDLPANTTCTATITTAAKSLAGTALASAFPWSFRTGPAPDGVLPTVISVTPTTVACPQVVGATFSVAMDPATINTTTFNVKLTGPPLGTAVAGAVAYDQASRLATFTPSSALTVNTSYTATVTTGVRDLSGEALLADRVWTFISAPAACPPVTPPSTIVLGTAAPFGTLGGTAGTTNAGLRTVINGNLGTTATTTSSVTGFHDSLGDVYTTTTLNNGSVTGFIQTCTVSTTGPTAAAVNPANCTIATQALADARTAFNNLSPASLPGGTDPGAGQLGGLTLAPGVYQAASGSFLITGSDLTLNGDANAVWVFQTASTLTVGAPGAPRSIILTGGALAKNVFWRVGTSATINGAGGGTMVGTILASEAVSFSTDGNNLVDQVVTLNGRAMGLNASVTMTNTVINVPAP